MRPDGVPQSFGWYRLEVRCAFSPQFQKQSYYLGDKGHLSLIRIGETNEFDAFNRLSAVEMDVEPF